MSSFNQKKAYSKRGSFDEMFTPREAVEIIIPFIPVSVKTVWECTDLGNSKISQVLREKGYKVISSHIDDDFDFLEQEPDQYDIIITNPPYSLKNQFLKRGFELNKPFMFLLPITTLEGKERGELFNKYDIALIIPNKRFNFKKEKKSSAWFQTSWFVHKIRTPNQLNFIHVP